MQLTITRPDDWHLHLRDGEALAAVLPHTARQFARAIVMPNLKPPVTTVEQAAAYRDRILAALPAGDWALQGALSPEERTEAALGWLLAGYRFDRDRPGRKPADLARLVCPDGVDADPKHAQTYGWFGTYFKAGREARAGRTGAAGTPRGQKLVV